jgi:hypothetical protein
MQSNLIHIGLPKCASTTLQDRLFASQNRFIYLGRIKNGYQDEQTRELFERITFQDSLEYDAKATWILTQRLCAAAADPSRPILVSAESLSVEGRADRRLIAERLHQLFAPAKILIILRSQHSMLQSLYLNHLRAAGQHLVSFEQWIEAAYGGIRFTETHRVGLNYDSLVQLYDEMFGPENVVVLPFEQISGDNSQFFPMLADMLGMAASEVRECFNRNAENQRLSSRHLFALRVQDRLPGGTNLAHLGRRWLSPAVYEPLRRLVTGGRRVASPALPERWNHRIAAAYGPSNARLASRKRIPLAALGYPMAQEVGRASEPLNADLRISLQ